MLLYSRPMFFRGQIIGKYKMLSTIGSGGFGTVYLAEDTWIDKKVALKVPHKQSVDFGELLREPRLLATLNHPNIVAILTAEKQDNVFFIVMEFVPGETLEAIIAARRRARCRRWRSTTPVRSAMPSTTPIVRACCIATCGHRMCWSPTAAWSKVADFGTSRFLEIAAHGTTVIGSPPYMAPEQFQGKAVFASDIYSLGVTMYQMFTGVMPYDTPSPADIDRLFRGDLVTAPRLKNPKLPKAMNDIVMKAMAPDIPSRYQRASDVLDDVLAVRKRGDATDTVCRRIGARRGSGDSNPIESPGGPSAALLLALPEAAPRTFRSLPVLRRSSVVHGPFLNWPNTPHAIW